MIPVSLIRSLVNLFIYLMNWISRKPLIKIEGSYEEKFEPSGYSKDRIILTITNWGHSSVYIKTLELSTIEGENLDFIVLPKNDEEETLLSSPIAPGDFIKMKICHLEGKYKNFSDDFILTTARNTLECIRNHCLQQNKVVFSVVARCKPTKGKSFYYCELFQRNYNEINYGFGNEPFLEEVKKTLQYAKHEIFKQKDPI